MRRPGPLGTEIEPTRAASATSADKTAAETGRHSQVHDNLDFGSRSRQDCRAHMQRREGAEWAHSHWPVTEHTRDLAYTVLQCGMGAGVS